MTNEELQKELEDLRKRYGLLKKYTQTLEKEAALYVQGKTSVLAMMVDLYTEEQ